MTRDAKDESRAPSDTTAQRLMLGLSALSIVAGVIVLFSSSAAWRAPIYLVTTALAVVAVILTGRRKSILSRATILAPVGSVALVGLFSSLLFREDYFGGSCARSTGPLVTCAPAILTVGWMVTFVFPLTRRCATMLDNIPGKPAGVRIFLLCASTCCSGPMWAF